uniref:TonB-dependent receptor n=1 Tax=Prevotellamassilia timonensis TaxID=1852370 RepID=UPI0040253260
MEKIIRQLVIVIGAVLFSLVAHAANDTKDTDANIYGHVINKKTSKHIPNVTISVKGTLIATQTDASGHYFLKNLPEGKFTLEANMDGFRTISKSVVLHRDSTIELNFKLDPSDIDLDDAVVSANRIETKRRLAPTLVNVLGSKMFDLTQSTCLVQGLNFQPGVRTEDDCQNCGFTQVRINGLDGHYSQILINSRPIYSSLNGVYGLEQIPSNMIDRVEVVRGGGSALYGASAIGGTINVITKDPIRNSASFGHTFMSLGHNSFDNITMGNASLVTDNNKAGVYVFGQSRERKGYDYDRDGYTELPELSNQTFGLNSFYRLSPYSRIGVQYHSTHEFRRGGNNLNMAPHEANIAEQAEHNIQGGGIIYDFNAPNQKDKVNAYFSFQTTTRKSYYGGIG